MKPLDVVGKVVAASLAEGAISRDVRKLIEHVERSPHLVHDVIDGLVEETAKPAPDEEMVEADAFILARLLEIIRYGVEAGRREERELAESVRQRLLQAEADGSMEPELLLLVLQQFVSAGLEVGDELRALAKRAATARAADADADAPMDEASARRQLTELLLAVGGDPFAAHAGLTEVVGALPVEMQAKLVGIVASDGDVGLADVAVGFLLDPSPEVRAAARAGLAHLRVDPPIRFGTMLRRLQTIGAWLPEAERAELADVVAALSAQGVVAAAAPVPAATVRASACGVDGSGVQGLIVARPGSRKIAIAGVIRRLGVGVFDGWVRPDASKAEVKEMFNITSDGVALVDVRTDDLAVMVQAALADNQRSGKLPPFVLVAFAEIAGLAALTPVDLEVEALVATMLDGTSPEELAAGPAKGKGLVATSLQTIARSWFEEGDAVDAALTGKGTRKQKVEALLSGPLEQSRRRWAATFAWTAKAMRRREKDTGWLQLALAARELIEGRSLADVPLMRMIAEASVDNAKTARRVWG